MERRLLELELGAGGNSVMIRERSRLARFDVGFVIDKKTKNNSRVEKVGSSQ